MLPSTPKEEQHLHGIIIKIENLFVPFTQRVATLNIGVIEFTIIDLVADFRFMSI